MFSRILINTGPSRRGWHRLEAMLRCPQLYAYTHVLKMRDETAPLIRGSLGHVGLAHWYARMRAQQVGEDPNRYYEPMEAIALVAQQMGAAGEAFRSEMQSVVQGYIAHYLAERLRIVAIEEEVEMYFGPHLLTQRFDGVVMDSKGLHYVLDHKFVAALSAKTEARYALSGQFMAATYQGRNKYGDAFGGVYLNLVGVQRRTFKRVLLPPVPHALARFPQTVADAEALIASCAQRDPWDYPKALSELVCMTPYGPCPGVDWCSWGPKAGGNG